MQHSHLIQGAVKSGGELIKMIMMIVIMIIIIIMMIKMSVMIMVWPS